MIQFGVCTNIGPTSAVAGHILLLYKRISAASVQALSAQVPSDGREEKQTIEGMTIFLLLGLPTGDYIIFSPQQLTHLTPYAQTQTVSPVLIPLGHGPVAPSSRSYPFQLAVLSHIFSIIRPSTSKHFPTISFTLCSGACSIPSGAAMQGGKMGGIWFGPRVRLA